MPWYWGVTRRFIVNSSYRLNFDYHVVGGRRTIEEPYISALMRMSELAIRTRQPGDFERVTHLLHDICFWAYRRQFPYKMPSDVGPRQECIPDPLLESLSRFAINQDDDVYRRGEALMDDTSAGPSTYGMNDFFLDYGTELGVSCGLSMGNTFVTLMIKHPLSSSTSIPSVTYGVPRGIQRHVSPVPWESNDEHLLPIVEEPAYLSTMDLGRITQVDHLQADDTEELPLSLWRQRRNIKRRGCGT